MEHAYIDEHSIAERYISRRLTVQERDEFERHLVDCQECADRIVLANMFRAHQLNGIVEAEKHAAAKSPPAPRPPEPQAETPLVNQLNEPAAMVVRIKPKQLAVTLGVSLLAITVIVFAVLKLFSPR